MTVSSQRNKVIYIGNGVATEFAIPFSFLEQEHLACREKRIFRYFSAVYSARG